MLYKLFLRGRGSHPPAYHIAGLAQPKPLSQAPLPAGEDLEEAARNELLDSLI